MTMILHVTCDLSGRLRAMGLLVAEFDNGLTVWCEGCTERQTYFKSPNGWKVQAFLHDRGCPQFRARISRYAEFT